MTSTPDSSTGASHPAEAPAAVGRLTARVVLVGLSVLLVWGAWRPLSRHGSDTPDERTDSALYSAVATRVAEGEPYYPVLGAELHARGYPTGSVFNWRPPTLTLMLAHAPVASFVLLLALVVAVIGGTTRLFYPEPPGIMLFALLMQIGASASAFNPFALVLHETWAGLCLALSAILYAFRRFVPAALLLLAGLFIRELVAPFALVCGLIAMYRRRRAESAIFAVGGIAFLAFYLWHAGTAAQTMMVDAPQHDSWVQWGGPRFVLATIGFGGWLYLLPTWVPAIAAALLMASPWSPVSAMHAKAGAFVYILCFMIVGQRFNQYWGWLVAPLWAIGYGLGFAGLVQLTRSAFRNPTPRDDVARSSPRRPDARTPIQTRG